MGQDYRREVSLREHIRDGLPGLNGWIFGTGSTVAIPPVPGFVGLPLRAQGAELLPPVGSCSSPVLLNLTDIVTAVVQ